MLRKKYKVDYYSSIKRLKPSEIKTINSILNNEKNVEFLFSIIIVEKMNREKMFFLEKLLSLLFPKLTIKLDLSIGLCQIKPSTAKLVSDGNDCETLRLLIYPDSNIETMCKLIKYYEKICNTDLEILNSYLTGKKKPKMNKELRIYYQLVQWSSKNKFYSKFIERI